MDCHHSMEESKVTSIPPETHALTTDLRTQQQTLGILLDQLGQKAQDIPRVSTSTDTFKASIKLLLKEHRGLASPLEQGLLGVRCHRSKTRRGPGACIGPLSTKFMNPVI